MEAIVLREIAVWYDYVTTVQAYNKLNYGCLSVIDYCKQKQVVFYKENNENLRYCWYNLACL